MKKNCIKIFCSVALILQVLALAACGSGGSSNANASNHDSATDDAASSKAPTVIITPANNSANIILRPKIKLQFSESVTNVNIDTVSLKEGDHFISLLQIPELDNSYTFRPLIPLKANTQYTVTVSSGITSVSTNEHIDTTTSSFTTMVNHYAYITNYNESTITLCEVSSYNGGLSNCIPTGSGFKNAYGVVVDQSFSHAYIANESGAISICSISNSDGTLTNCNAFTDDSIPTAYGLAIDPLGRYLYIATFQSGTITKCAIKIDGDLGDCTTVPFDATGATSFDISLSPDGSSAYISTYKGQVIKTCHVISDGTFDFCETYNLGNYFDVVSAIATNPLISGNVYVVDDEQTGNALSCNVYIDGGTGVCNPTGYTFTKPGGITLDQYGSYAYITNTLINSISVCSSVNGQLKNCGSTTDGNAFNAPEMITVY